MKKYPFYQPVCLLILMLSIVSCTAKVQRAGKSVVGEEAGAQRVYDLLIVSTPGELQLEISCTLP